MDGNDDIEIVQLTRPNEAGPAIRRAMTDCWIAVTNAGGAAGFPFPPVDAGHVAPAVDALVARLDPRLCRILLARNDGALAGWVVLSREDGRLLGHIGFVNHLQAHPGLQRRGVGSSLMRALRGVARDEMGLEQVHLAARGGVGLEHFYGGLGWREIGRWPNKLRIAPGDTREEILMILAPL